MPSVLMLAAFLLKEEGGGAGLIRTFTVLLYTGGILQRLDTDVHSAVTAMVRIVMLQR